MRKPIPRKPPLIPQEYARKVCERLGIETLPPDHPIYSEGPTIMFVPQGSDGDAADPATDKDEG